jgi:hypothetical protein
VNGIIALRAGQPARVDGVRVFSRAQSSVRAIIARLGLPLPGNWSRSTH